MFTYRYTSIAPGAPARGSHQYNVLHAHQKCSRVPGPIYDTHRNLAPFRFVGKHAEGLVAATRRVTKPHPTRGLCTIYEMRRLSSIYYIAMCSVLFLYSAIYISRHLSRVFNMYKIRVCKRLRPYRTICRFMVKCYCLLRTRRGLAGSGQFF